MGEFANQYGINLGAIDQAVSARKTAEQNIEMNDIKVNALARQDKQDIATEQADQDYLKDLDHPKDPKTAVAQTIAQKVQWGQLDDQQKKQTANALKLKIDQHGQAINGIMSIKDQVQQQQGLQQFVSSLSEPEKQEYVKKYGSTPQQWQDNLPRAMNDLLVADGGIDLLQKQAEAKTKQANELAIATAKEKFLDKKQEKQNDFTAGQNSLSRDNSKQNALISHSDRGAPTASSNVASDALAYKKQKDKEEMSAKTAAQDKKDRKDAYNDRYNRAKDLVPSDLSLPSDKENFKNYYATYGKLPEKVNGVYKTSTPPKSTNTNSTKPPREAVMAEAKRRGIDVTKALKQYGY